MIDIDKDTYISAEDNPTDDNDELKFYTDGTQRMMIDSNGTVGIGVTPNNSTYTFIVDGTSLIERIKISSSNIYCMNDMDYLNIETLKDDSYIRFRPSSTDVMQISKTQVNIYEDAKISGTLDVTGDTTMEGNLTFTGGAPNGILFNSETTFEPNASTKDGATIYYESDNLVIEKTDGNQEGYHYPDGGTSGIHFRSRNNSGTTYTDMVLEGGKLGIGIESPSEALMLMVMPFLPEY